MKPIVLVLAVGLSMFMVSCQSSTEGGPDSEITASDGILTTDAFVKEANELGKDEFEKKYPKDSEIELEGKIVTVAVWQDKVNAKFGTGLNDLPVKCDFMFSDNGGSKESTREKVKIGETIRFKGKISFSFFQEDGKLKYCNLVDCVAL